MEVPDFDEALNFAETEEVPDFDPVTEPQFRLEDMDPQERSASSSGFFGSERATSALSDAASMLSFHGDDASSEASFETVILAASEADDRSWSFSEGTLYFKTSFLSM